MCFSFIHSVTTRPWGRVNGDGSGDGLPVPNGDERDGDASVEAISERILYWLSLDTQVRALAERLLPKVCRNSERSASQPRAPRREHSGLYRHSLEVALKAAEAFSSLARRRSEGWYSKPISGRLEASVGMRSLKINVGSVNPQLAVLRIKIVLLGTKPPIWRRVLVPAEFTLAQLHDVVQAAMGWEDCHLHQFYIGKQRFGVPDLGLFHESNKNYKRKLTIVTFVTLEERHASRAQFPRQTR